MKNPISRSPVSFLIYLTLPQQTQRHEVQLDISPLNQQWVMKRGKSCLARIPFPIQSPKLHKVPFICPSIEVHLCSMNEFKHL